MNEPSFPVASVDVVEERTPELIDLTLRFRDPSFVGDRLLLDDTHEAEVFGPSHPIIAGLIEIEIEQLVALGDSEIEARAWLIERSGTIWMASFRQGAVHTADNAEGLIRMTGANRSHRMIEDLAYLLGEKDLGGLEQELSRRLNVAQIRPFLDLTTLDITPLGALSKEERLANLYRLLQMILFVGLRSSQLDGVSTGTALLHPRVFKFLPLFGIPVVDLGFGVMDYKLSNSNLTPMPTQAIGISFKVAPAAFRSGSEFMQACGATIARNGYSIEIPE